MYIVASPINILQISPLFFLGSTLIFIGYDLLYEWLIEIRTTILLEEYLIVWFSFIAIQIVGINNGILLGVLISILYQVISNVNTLSIINRVQKNSRAIWTPTDTKILHDHAYNPVHPKIVTLEVIGTVFFGSSLNLLNRIMEEIGISHDSNQNDSVPPSGGGRHTSSVVLSTPGRTPRSQLLQARNAADTVPTDRTTQKPSSGKKKKRLPPKYLVLDLMNVSNLDASATRGCFLQLVKICAKKNILVCASGSTPKIEWMFRNHGVSLSTTTEEDKYKAKLLCRRRSSDDGLSSTTTDATATDHVESILLFVTVQEGMCLVSALWTS